MAGRVYRLEGFAGQRSVVLPPPLRGAARRQPLLRGLLVTDAGYYPAADGHRVEREGGAPTTLVILCLRGRGWCRVDGEGHAIRAGHFLWLPAKRRHAYGAEEAEPWTIAWAHCDGEEVGAWQELLFAGAEARPPVLELPEDRLDEIALDRTCAALERGFAVRHQVAAAAALRHALGAVAEMSVERGGGRSAQERVLASVASLREDWRRHRRLDELATAAGLSVTHYSALFRRLTGFAPIDFLIRLRVRHAARLLENPALSVGEVAAGVGYDDAYYFSRCFRRVMGTSPRGYRKMTRG